MTALLVKASRVPLPEAVAPAVEFSSLAAAVLHCRGVTVVVSDYS